MSVCRIYLFTYNRNEILPRAVESLLNQTFTNWICELHNDMPDNTFPRELLQRLDDKRFILKDHEINLGPVQSFNLAFQHCSEEFISILEDDNWWEPEFLEVMIRALGNHKNIQVAWSNMNLWREETRNRWGDLKQTIWPHTNASFQLFDYPDPKKAYHAMHSNGAMMIRNGNLADLKTPLKIRFDFVEQIRERSFSHPILFVNRPLANFSITLQTNRSISKEGIHEHFLLLLASYFNFFSLDDQNRKDIWLEVRKSKVKSSNKLLFAGIASKNCRSFLRNATLYDWLYFLAYNVKYPKIIFQCFRAKIRYKELWEYLQVHTKSRFEQANLASRPEASAQAPPYTHNY